MNTCRYRTNLHYTMFDFRRNTFTSMLTSNASPGPRTSKHKISRNSFSKVKPSSPVRSYHISLLPLHMETMPFPHLESSAYFQPSSTPCTRSISPHEPPRPQKMLSIASEPSHPAHQRRRSSGIPRRATSSTQDLLAAGVASSTIRMPQSPSSANRGSPLCSYSLQSCDNNAPSHRDLSGVRQQLHVRNFSTKTVDGLEVFSTPRSTAVRSLMRPLEPPLPRSHTMSNIALNQQPSSTACNGKKREYPSPSRSEAGLEIDVIDALHESRMSREELELFNRVEKEKELNKARLPKTTRFISVMSPPSHVAQVKQDIDTSAASWLLSSRPDTSRNAVQMHTKEGSNGFLRINTSLSNACQTPRGTLPTSRPLLNAVTPSHKIDPRHVSKLKVLTPSPSPVN